AYVLAYATDAMRLAGLGFLQIQDEDGRVVSSGHFRNEFGRLGPALPPGEGSGPPGPTLVRAAAAEGPFLALVTSDTLSVARRRFRLVGGTVVDSSFLLRLARVAPLAALLLAGWLSTRISTPVEARIAIGDLARQVNHDVKNGLAPLRNVFRHLTQVARDKPDELRQVFTERQGTVESSINYL